MVPGATVKFNASGGSLIFSNPISIANGTLSASGGTPLFAGGITNINGNVTITGSSIMGGPVNIPGGFSLQFNGNYYNTLTFSNVVSGSGNFGMQYQSIVKMAASNTYSGNITVPNCNSGSDGLGGHLDLIGNGSISHVPSIYLQGIATGQAYAGYMVVTNRTDGTLTLFPNQTLRGDNGSQVIGSVVVGSGATLKMVNYQSMTITSNLTFQAGSTNIMDVSDALQQSDVVSVGGTLTYGGTLQINTNGSALQANDSFQLFPNAASYSGTFANIVPTTPGAGLAWNTNNLAVNGTLAVAAAVNLTPCVLTNMVSGSQMTLSWPADHQGWLVQSNSVDLANPSDWYPIPETASETSYIINIDATQTNVFYRLISPPSP